MQHGVSTQPVFSCPPEAPAMPNLPSPRPAPSCAGQLHVTQNEGCEQAVVVSVFPVAGIDAYFFPYSEASGRGRALLAALGL